MTIKAKDRVWVRVTNNSSGEVALVTGTVCLVFEKGKSTLVQLTPYELASSTIRDLIMSRCISIERVGTDKTTEDAREEWEEFPPLEPSRPVSRRLCSVECPHVVQKGKAEWDCSLFNTPLKVTVSQSTECYVERCELCLKLEKVPIRSGTSRENCDPDCPYLTTLTGSITCSLTEANLTLSFYGLWLRPAGCQLLDQASPASAAGTFSIVREQSDSKRKGAEALKVRTNIKMEELPPKEPVLVWTPKKKVGKAGLANIQIVQPIMIDIDEDEDEEE